MPGSGVAVRGMLPSIPVPPSPSPLVSYLAHPAQAPVGAEPNRRRLDGGNVVCHAEPHFHLVAGQHRAAESAKGGIYSPVGL